MPPPVEGLLEVRVAHVKGHPAGEVASPEMGVMDVIQMRRLPRS